MNTLFNFELLAVVVVIAAVAAIGIYVTRRDRRARRAAEGEGVRVDREPADRVSTEKDAPRRSPREFYKSLGLETTEDMKMRLYSITEYRNELDGAEDAATQGGFVAALKAYRWLDDEWIEYSPDKAAAVLELTPNDYEVDAKRRALLLRRLPPGMPVSARDAL